MIIVLFSIPGPGFHRGSVRTAASRRRALPRFALDNFRIESTIDSSLVLKAVTRATLTPKQTLGPALPFNISHNMRVTEARIDGEPVEIFERESLRSNLIASSDNDQFLLVAAAPLDPSRAHEIEIHHEGEVIQKAGDDVYYVTSRGTWYPRLGMEFANYEMTFRYPRNLTLVATGAPVPGPHRRRLAHHSPQDRLPHPVGRLQPGKFSS